MKAAKKIVHQHRYGSAANAATYVPGKVVILGSQEENCPAQYLIVCGTWNTSSMYGSGTCSATRLCTAATSATTQPPTSQSHIVPKRKVH